MSLFERCLAKFVLDSWLTVPSDQRHQLFCVSADATLAIYIFLKHLRLYTSNPKAGISGTATQVVVAKLIRTM
eukprot:1975959-Amphidinium_carterae.1